MKRYRKLQRIVMIGIVSYMGAAIAMPLATGRHEIYPIFDWNLYSHVPNRIVEYELWIGSDTPGGERCLATVRKRYRPDRRRVSVHEIRPVLRQLGAALDSGDASTVESSWEWIERFVRVQASAAEGMLPAIHVRIARVIFDPLERYRTGRIRERVVVAERRFGVTT